MHQLRARRARHGLLSGLRVRDPGDVAGVAARAPAVAAGGRRRSPRDYTVPGCPADVVPAACADMGCRGRGGGRGVGRVVDGAHQGAGALCLPAQLRQAADREAESRRIPDSPLSTATFSVSYPAEGSAYRDTGPIPRRDGRTCSSVTAATLQLFREPAAGRSPKDIAASLVRRTFPDVDDRLQIPNAMVGYQPGYGEAADCWPQGAHSSFCADAGDRDGGGEERPGAGGVRGRSLSPVRAGLRPGATVRSRTSRSPRTWANTSTASRGAGDPPRYADYRLAARPVVDPGHVHPAGAVDEHPTDSPAVHGTR